MKQLSDLTREQLEDIVGQVRDTLWRDPLSGDLDPDRSWDSETIEWVSGVLEDAGLKPDPDPAGLADEPRRLRGAGHDLDAVGAGGIHPHDRGDRRLHPARRRNDRPGRRGASSTPWTTIPSRPPMRRGWTSRTHTSWPAGPWTASRWSRTRTPRTTRASASDRGAQPRGGPGRAQSRGAGGLFQEASRVP